MTIPVRSKKSKDVIRAVAQILARVRSLRIPVNRVRTDRGQEFCSKEFQEWIRVRDLWHTTTAGDEPSTNSRAEKSQNVDENHSIPSMAIGSEVCFGRKVSRSTPTMRCSMSTTVAIWNPRIGEAEAVDGQEVEQGGLETTDGTRESVGTGL